MVDYSQVGLCCLAHNFPRDAHSHMSIRNDRPGGQHRAGRYDTTFADLASVKHNRPGGNQRPRADSTAMDYGPVPHAYSIGNIKRHAALNMNDRTILNVYPCSNANGGNIASNHDMVHDGGLISNVDVTANKGCFRNIHVLTQDRLKRWRHRGNCTAESGGCRTESIRVL